MRQNFVVSDLEYFKICLLLSEEPERGQAEMIHARDGAEKSVKVIRLVGLSGGRRRRR
jgi:hypothetical protein